MAAVTASWAEASTGTACISRAEYLAIHRGIRQARVTPMAGVKGRRAEGRARSYRACGGSSRVLGAYSAWNKVQHKYRMNTLASDPPEHSSVLLGAAGRVVDISRIMSTGVTQAKSEDES